MSESVIAQSRSSALLELLREQFCSLSTRAALGDGKPALSWQFWSHALHAPLEEFLGRSGKEFRARLVETSYQVAGGKGSCPQKLMILVEILHAGSLIIDDIEDGSELRRGAPALHRLVGVPVAINAGNWLYFWACSLVEQVGVGPHAELAMHRWLNSTLLKCHYGQALDLRLKVSELSQQEVFEVVATATRLKTGCLVELAAVLGAIAAGANRGTVQALADFGRALGIGLQMLDDYGGLTSEHRKPKGFEDLALGRPTWPWAWSSERLEEGEFTELQTLSRKVESGELLPEQLAVPLRLALGAEPRVLIRNQLWTALDRLKRRVKTSQALTTLSAELHHLEQSYG